MSDLTLDVFPTLLKVIQNNYYFSSDTLDLK